MTQFLKTAFFALFFMMVALPSLEAASPHDPVDEIKPFYKDLNLSDFTFINAQDQKISMAEYQGSWVVLNLWATWCPPCITELKTFEELDFKVPDKDFKVLALSVDVQRRGPNLQKFLEDVGVYELTFAYDPVGAALRTFRYRGLPTTYIIDPESNVYAYFEGVADWAHADTIEEIYKVTHPERKTDPHE